MAKKKTVLQPKDFRPSQADLATAPERAPKINRVLAKTYPGARTALEHENALQLLIATILAAQSTDKRVNMVTKDLFRKYRSAKDFANADAAQLEDEIRSTGFFRNKAKSIRTACRDIVEKHAGEVPDTMEGLVGLAGVGRKTANVVLGECFDAPGIIADTHVLRLSRLLGLSARPDDPVKLEQDLMKLLPRKEWTLFSHRLVFHGRNICIARKPDCPHCPVRDLCPYGQLTAAQEPAT